MFQVVLQPVIFRVVLVKARSRSGTLYVRFLGKYTEVDVSFKRGGSLPWKLGKDGEFVV